MLRCPARFWIVFAAMLLGIPTARAAELAATDAPRQAASAARAAIVVPAGTQVDLVVTRPVLAKSVKLQDPIYAQTTFPVTTASGMAIPPGTYMEGEIVSLSKPTRKVNRSLLRIQFTKMVFADGYTVSLARAGGAGDTVDVTVQVSTRNDLLLDNGAQMEMTLQSPLRLGPKWVAAAIPLSHAPQPGQMLSATRCRPTEASPGTPGTPDTVIPGTPDTVIPGVNGMPDTVIPGTPATTSPGVPGTPDTPGTTCPSAPLVISSVPVQ